MAAASKCAAEAAISESIAVNSSRCCFRCFQALLAATKFHRSIFKEFNIGQISVAGLILCCIPLGFGCCEVFAKDWEVRDLVGELAVFGLQLSQFLVGD